MSALFSLSEERDASLTEALSLNEAFDYQDRFLFSLQGDHAQIPHSVQVAQNSASPNPKTVRPFLAEFQCLNVRVH